MATVIDSNVSHTEPRSQRDETSHPWLVATRHTAGACAGVSVVDDGLVVFVSDSESASRGTMVELLPDGTARVQCQQAPQALYVHGGQAELVPELPGLCDNLSPADDDLIVLASAGVLEYLPRGFGLVVARMADETEADVMLSEMLSYAKAGGAAVVRRLPLT